MSREKLLLTQIIQVGLQFLINQKSKNQTLDGKITKHNPGADSSLFLPSRRAREVLQCRVRASVDWFRQFELGSRNRPSLSLSLSRARKGRFKYLHTFILFPMVKRAELVRSLFLFPRQTAFPECEGVTDHEMRETDEEENL